MYLSRILLSRGKVIGMMAKIIHPEEPLREV
jgi:hypothetical protein